MEESYPTVLALSRKVNGKEQRIMVTGDADLMSNGELGMNRKDLFAGNFYFINAAFYWLSNEEVPIDMRRPQPADNTLGVGEKGWAVAKICFRWVLPLLLVAIGLLIWVRRRGR